MRYNEGFPAEEVCKYALGVLMGGYFRRARLSLKSFASLKHYQSMVEKVLTPIIVFEFHIFNAQGHNGTKIK